LLAEGGLTHEAWLLEKAGLIARDVSTEDHRVTVVTITDAGHARADRVLPGHIHVVRDLLFDALSDQDARTLGDIMRRARDHMRTRSPRSAAPRRRTQARR
jgi:DNA-binding MarR family transcriptional regulator